MKEAIMKSSTLISIIALFFSVISVIVAIGAYFNKCFSNEYEDYLDDDYCGCDECGNEHLTQTPEATEE